MKQGCHSVEGRPPANVYDLDIDPMTLILDLYLDVLRRTCVPKIKFLTQGFQKFEREQTDRNQDTRDRKHYQAAFASGKKLTIHEYENL